ncbi:MAG TPA: hypothetical protein VF789_08875 [Thermoanaerobaculia bacterium]
MRTTKDFLPATAVLLVLAAGCEARQPETASESEPAAPAAATAPESAPPASGTTTAAPSGSTAAPPATAEIPQTAPATAAPLASQTSNWPGVVADVNEFRRKGSTLTARVTFRNSGPDRAEPDIRYSEVYVMDTTAGKKYEVLRDEKGTYIAALRSGYSDRWYEYLQPGQTYTVWMKFPAPPQETKTITLQVPGVPPFEDLPIQDS